MKLAVSGKGGVGKTTFAALLIRTLNQKGKRVLAIDADPDANLAAALGIADGDKITPISEMKDLVFERTGAQPGWQQAVLRRHATGRGGRAGVRRDLVCRSRG